MSDKVIVSAAITGAIHTPYMSDFLPITPRQIIDEIIRVYDAGAACAHVHVRDPQTGYPVNDENIYREVISEVKKRCPIVICITTGGRLGMTSEERVQAVPLFKPELASFNAGSMNFALHRILENKKKPSKFEWEEQYLSMTEDLVFGNSLKSLKHFCRIFKENGTKPELEADGSWFKFSTVWKKSFHSVEKTGPIFHTMESFFRIFPHYGKNVSTPWKTVGGRDAASEARQVHGASIAGARGAGQGEG